jgi:hypothetical protein
MKNELKHDSLMSEVLLVGADAPTEKDPAVTALGEAGY